MLESSRWGQLDSRLVKRALTAGWWWWDDGGGGGWIWRQDNEELCRASDRDTHRSLALSCKEKWLSDWEGSDLYRNESSTASSASADPPHHKELHYNLCLPLLIPALQGGLLNVSPQLFFMNVKMVHIKSCRLNGKSWVYFASNERTG